MIGLALMARDLAIVRADKAAPNGQWYVGDLRQYWVVQSRKHGGMFPTSPTGQYYRIIDAISQGRKL
jgi:hypothetical protein